MPPRPQLLFAASLISVLTLGSLWLRRGPEGPSGNPGIPAESGKTPPFRSSAAGESKFAQAAAGNIPVTAFPGDASRRKAPPGSFGQEARHRPASRPAPLPAGLSSSVGESLPLRRGLPQFSREVEPVTVEPLSEEELQWRAAKVEQEANHDLKHLVALLELDQEQQDRIFQTLARRSPDWHPGLQPVIIAEDGRENHHAGGSFNQPRSTSTGQTEVPDSAPVSGGTSAASIRPADVVAGQNPHFPSEVPLVEALAPDLTPTQQVKLAEDELNRLEWWESIIPRLLPGEGEAGTVYAVPPENGNPALDGLGNPIPSSE